MHSQQEGGSEPRQQSDTPVSSRIIWQVHISWHVRRKRMKLYIVCRICTKKLTYHIKIIWWQDFDTDHGMVHLYIRDPPSFPNDKYYFCLKIRVEYNKP